jgi:hypothetical protein
MIPEILLRCNTLNMSLDELLHKFENGYKYEALHAPSNWLLGFRIPPFQRALVWTIEQKVRFVESAWLGLHLGTYIVNSVDKFNKKTEKYHFADRYLIDGQQRLNALYCYWQNEFPVFGEYWNETSQDVVVKRRFGHIIFARSVTNIEDEATLRELYNRLNFGGTAHTEDERA